MQWFCLVLWNRKKKHEEINFDVNLFSNGALSAFGHDCSLEPPGKIKK